MKRQEEAQHKKKGVPAAAAVSVVAWHPSLLAKPRVGKGVTRKLNNDEDDDEDDFSSFSLISVWLNEYSFPFDENHSLLLAGDTSRPPSCYPPSSPSLLPFPSPSSSYACNCGSFSSFHLLLLLSSSGCSPLGSRVRKSCKEEDEKKKTRNAKNESKNFLLETPRALLAPLPCYTWT